jgi:alpha/beta superfamily hydrolase
MPADPRAPSLAEPTEIRSGTILPARREEIALVTSDGLTLVGELALPAEGSPAATLVLLHPLPTHGGSMDSHVFRKASWRLPATAGLAVLRFNTRGTTSSRGTSQGAFDAGRAERFDVEAALRFAAERDLPRRWLVGWSFGTDLALMHGRDPSIEGAILLSPPLQRATEADLAAWDAFGRSLVVVVPALDPYLRPDPARERFAAVRQAEVIGVPGAGHLWVGEAAVRRVLDEVVRHVLPESRLPESRKENS